MDHHPLSYRRLFFVHLAVYLLLGAVAVAVFSWPHSVPQPPGVDRVALYQQCVLQQKYLVTPTRSIGAECGHYLGGG